MSGRAIELTIPAEKDMMLVVRMTTASVLSRAGLTLDEVDDMKLAVDEACSCLISQAARFRRICLCFEYDEVAVCVRVAGLACDTHAGIGMGCEGLDILRCVLASLVDEVELESENDGVCAITLKKRGVIAAGKFHDDQ